MILDLLSRSSAYRSFNPRFAAAFEFLRRPDLATLAAGKYELEGADLYALIQHYTSKLPAQGKWEAHRKYLDIQYVYDGVERIGYAPLEKMKVVKEYSEKDDFMHLSGEGDLLLVPAGSFAVFAPHDAHMPGMAAGEPAAVKKCVVKVRV